jgi:Glyoxalase/Bleomycin resistance protein/Dioxygenase superfamily
MIRNWPGIRVSDTVASSEWYRFLLNCQSALDEHSPDRIRFDQLVDSDGAVLLCLLQWDAHEDHWAGDQSGIGRGVELYFVVDDFDDVLERVDQLRAEMVQENRPLTEAFQTRELKILDRDGYVVGIGDRSKGWLANSGLT